jgi:hypothetical protein
MCDVLKRKNLINKSIKFGVNASFMVTSTRMSVYICNMSHSSDLSEIFLD